VRVGVVADTHVGEHLYRLPAGVGEALAGVDLILHAGDLSHPVVLDDLRRIAPVVAVRGNHDTHPGLAHLPREIVVRIGDVRIGLTHGARTAAVELPAAVASLVAGRACLLGFDRAMRARFGEVACVVVGHLHMPIARRVGGALLFSPGAVYVPELDPTQVWSGLAGRGYRRFRRNLPPSARVPSVGMLEVSRAGVRARVVPARVSGDPSGE
jgi:putative phosphoesterase